MKKFLCHYNAYGMLLASYPVTTHDYKTERECINAVFKYEISSIFEVGDSIKLEEE